jgi:glycosyltransferase involved in cell wall biosynthesis
MKPTVSVVMSVFNGEKYLPMAITSILDQTISDFEFLIIDDSSTDASLEIIQSFAQADHRIRVIKNDGHYGIPKSLNKGIALAQGEFIARMDADDISVPERFEKQIDFLHNNIDVAMIGSNIAFIDDDNVVISQSQYPCYPGQVRWRLLFSCSVVHPTVMFRKSLFNNDSFYYEETFTAAQDYELWSRISEDFRIANLPDVLLYLRKHENSVSQNKRNIQSLNEMKIIRKTISKELNQNLPENLILGFKDAYKISSTKEALLVSKLIIRLEKKTHNWDITPRDRVYIRWDASRRLRAIWALHKLNLYLLPVIIHSILLNPEYYIDWINNFTFR